MPVLSQFVAHSFYRQVGGKQKGGDTRWQEAGFRLGPGMRMMELRP